MAKAGDQSDGGGADPVQAYIDDIAAEHRAVFDRLHGLILHACPQAAVVLSYGIPTYKHGGRRLYLGAWKHGMSIYGWQKDQDGGFVSRHPELKTSTGTIRLPPQDAAGISDQELAGLIRTALEAG